MEDTFLMFCPRLAITCQILDYRGISRLKCKPEMDVRCKHISCIVESVENISPEVCIRDNKYQ